MPQNLRRYHESGQSHFVTFSCYHRRPKFATADAYDLFPVCLEEVAPPFSLGMDGYLIMARPRPPLISGPERDPLGGRDPLPEVVVFEESEVADPG